MRSQYASKFNSIFEFSKLIFIYSPLFKYFYFPFNLYFVFIISFNSTLILLYYYLFLDKNILWFISKSYIIKQIISLICKRISIINYITNDFRHKICKVQLKLYPLNLINYTHDFECVYISDEHHIYTYTLHYI